MNELRIRPMAHADLDKVIAVAASLNSAPRWPRSAYERALDLSGVPNRIALVAEISGGAIGFAIASLIPSQAELETIAISQPFQRCQAGTALLTALLRELGSRQITEITLEVRSSNIAAQAFYCAHSFITFSRRKGYYPDTGEDALIMRAVLPFLRK